MKLGIFKLVGKDCGNLVIGLGNSSVLDLVTLSPTGVKMSVQNVTSLLYVLLIDKSFSNKM